MKNSNNKNSAFLLLLCHWLQGDWATPGGLPGTLLRRKPVYKRWRQESDFTHRFSFYTVLNWALKASQYLNPALVFISLKREGKRSQWGSFLTELCTDLFATRVSSCWPTEAAVQTPHGAFKSSSTDRQERWKWYLRNKLNLLKNHFSLFKPLTVFIHIQNQKSPLSFING